MDSFLEELVEKVELEAFQELVKWGGKNYVETRIYREKVSDAAFDFLVEKRLVRNDKKSPTFALFKNRQPGPICPRARRHYNWPYKHISVRFT